MEKIPPKSRREFLKLMAAGAASVSTFGRSGRSSGALAETGDSTRPNVLMILLDDLNAWVGCMGRNPDVRTPNIDKLAQRGVLFSNAHCASPICNPSRASFLTGVRPATSGIYNNEQYLRQVMPDVVTLPQYFRSNGYHAVGGGKFFHFDDPLSWDKYFPSSKGEEPKPPNLPINGMTPVSAFDWGPVDVADEDMADAKTVRLAARELAVNKDRPFFLGVGLLRPHIPLYAPRKYFEMYPTDKITLPKVNPNDLDDVPRPGKILAHTELHSWIVQHHQWEKGVQGYLASISFADAQIGRVLDALDQSPFAGNTIIVLTADHGWHLGEKFHWQKLTLWEESTRVPLIISAPGVSPQGAVCNKAVSLMDIYPTLLELCGFPPKDEVEGTSIRQFLCDPGSNSDHPPAVTTLLGDNHSVRTDRYRYIRYRDGSEELYDHDADPLEWQNLAANSNCASVKIQLGKWVPTTVAPGPDKMRSDTT